MNNSYDTQNETKTSKESCWDERSKLEKKLIIFAGILASVIVIVIGIFAWFQARPETTCTSSSCIQTSNELLNYMDLNVNPCDDFYQFACGGFLDNTILEENKLKNVHTSLAKNTYKRMRKILEEPIFEMEPGSSLQLAKKFYKTCMNVTAVDKQGLELMKESLKQIGGWPVLEGNNWIKEKFDWKYATYKLRELGFGFEFFMVIDIGVDKNDPTKYTIEIHSPFSPLLRIPEEGEDYFHNYMVNLSVAFGADRMRSIEDFRHVISFKRSLFLDEDYDGKFEVLTISELKNRFFDIPWLEYINRLLQPAASITHQQFVTLYTPNYFARLQNALRRTPERVIANYIAWRTVRNNREFLPKSISNIKWMWYLKGEENPTRAMTCFRLTYDNFVLPLEAIYTRRYLPKKFKDDATEILNNIKAELKTTITNLAWIDGESTTKSIEKLSTVKNRIAFDDELINYDNIEQEYAGIEIYEDNFLASMLSLRFHKTNYKYKKLHKLVNASLHLESGLVSSRKIHYDDEEHSMFVSGRMLQEIVYDYSRPKYLNYGGLGTIIGHEISHIIFNPNNNNPEQIHNVLSTETRLNLNEKLSCLTIHYGKYRVPELGDHLNSSHTKTEDFLDIIGTKVAYDAYNLWEETYGPEQNLPGFNYTSKQLFWISSALKLCEKIAPEGLKNNLNNPIVSPRKYRVLGSLRNLAEFSKDFSCPSGTFMNSEERCNVF